MQPHRQPSCAAHLVHPQYHDRRSQCVFPLLTLLDSLTSSSPHHPNVCLLHICTATLENAAAAAITCLLRRRAVDLRRRRTLHLAVSQGPPQRERQHS